MHAHCQRTTTTTAWYVNQAWELLSLEEYWKAFQLHEGWISSVNSCPLDQQTRSAEMSSLQRDATAMGIDLEKGLGIDTPAPQPENEDMQDMRNNSLTVTEDSVPRTPMSQGAASDETKSSTRPLGTKTSA